MKLRNRKLLFAAIAVFLVSITSFVLLSFTRADDGTTSGGTTTVDAASQQNNIDNIILNSNGKLGGQSDKVYHIVEIGSSETPSPLSQIVKDSKDSSGKIVPSVFRNFVLGSPYKTINDTFGSALAAGTSTDTLIDYKHFSTKSSASDITAAVISADLVYIYNDPDNMFSKSNDIPDDNSGLPAALTGFVSAQSKPLIIDSFDATYKYAHTGESNYSAFVSSVLHSLEVNSRVYSWKNGTSIEDFMGTNAVYLPIHGDIQKQSGVWSNLGTAVKDDGTPYYVGKVLTIYSGDAASNVITTNLQTGVATTANKLTADGYKALFNAAASATDADQALQSFNNTYKLTDSAGLYSLGYQKREAKPDYIQYDSINLSDPASALTLDNAELGKYDFIVMEKSAADSILTKDQQAVLTILAKTGKTMIYDADLNNGSSASDLKGTDTSVNYKNILSTVSSNDVAKYDNVLISSKLVMTGYQNATSADEVQDFAYLLINSTFRGISGKGNNSDSANVYTVLEVEPCYPIDETLASTLYSMKSTQDKNTDSVYKNGSYKGFAENSNRGSLNTDNAFYYLRTWMPDGDMTSDQIQINGKSLADSEANNVLSQDVSSQASKDSGRVTDYYKWALSVAKIRHATGLQSVKVVHMSSTEFNNSKDALLDTYDAIYFGGDYSSYKDIKYWNDNHYLMYSHNGETYSIANNTVSVLAGNDITLSKFKELETYINNGMPVIFDSKISGYKASSNLVDPQSRMYTLLGFAYDKIDTESTTYANKDESTHVIWNFDETDTSVVDATSDNLTATLKLGAGIKTNAVTSTDIVQATVFTSSKDDGATIRTNHSKTSTMYSNDRLYSVLKNYQRPKLLSHTQPTEYTNYNRQKALDSVQITDHHLKWTYHVSDSKSGNDFSADVYIDGLTGDSPNSRFEAKELAASTSGKESEMSYTLPDSFFGPVYWKVIITSNVTHCSTSFSGISKVKRTTQEKIHINLLQIEPDSEGDNSLNSLYLCTECQNSRGIFENQRYSNVGMFEQNQQGLRSSFNDQSSAVDYVSVLNMSSGSGSTVVKNIQKVDSKYTYSGNQLGIHEHKFGIVETELDSKGQYTGYDDLTTNWFNLLSDDYDVDLTIFTTTQYENLVKAVNALYNGKSSDQIKAARQKYSTDSSLYQKYYLAMKALINGDIKSFNAISPEKRTDYQNRILSYYDSLKVYMNDEMGVSADTLNTYQEASPNIDNYLKTLRGVTSSDKTSVSDFNKEIDFMTDSSIERDQRDYYDFYSLYNDQNFKYARPYSDLYVVWRNAKIYEKFFHDKYMTNLEYASVNYNTDEATTVAADSTSNHQKLGAFNLKNTWDTIAVGAAEDYGNADLSVEGCNRILDFIEDGGNILLFHDTLTNAGNEVNMTSLLSTAFGQNARKVQAVPEKELNKDKSIVVGNGSDQWNFTTYGTLTLKPTDYNKCVYIQRNATYTYQDSYLSLTVNGSKYKGSDWTNCYSLDKGYNYNVKINKDTNGVELTKLSPILSGKNQKITFSVVDKAGNSSSGNNVSYDIYDAGWKYNGGFKANLSGSFSSESAETEFTNYTVSNEQYKLVDSDPEYKSTTTSDYIDDQTLQIRMTDGTNNPIAGFKFNLKIDGSNIVSLTTDSNGIAKYVASNYIKNSVASSSEDAAVDKNTYFVSKLKSTTAYKSSNCTEYGAFRNTDISQQYEKYQHKYVDIIENLAEDNQVFYSQHSAITEGIQQHKGGTDRAKQNNVGIVTKYPFTLGSKLNVALTTSQSFSTDTESDDLTVYYSLAGGSVGSQSSMYAADPLNGTDNYFLYQYNNVTYTGAGHSLVTGLDRNNDDERKLFINVLVNSVRKSYHDTTLQLYDHKDQNTDGEKHHTFIKDLGDNDNSGDNYYVKLTAKDSNIADGIAPFKFSYVASADSSSGVKLTHVRVYVDKDHADGSNTLSVLDASKGDVLLLESDSGNWTTSDIWNQIDQSSSGSVSGKAFAVSNGMKLKDEYFNAQGYCYIVVDVYDTQDHLWLDSEGKTGIPIQRRIRIEKADTLYDLN